MGRKLIRILKLIVHFFISVRNEQTQVLEPHLTIFPKLQKLPNVFLVFFRMMTCIHCIGVRKANIFQSIECTIKTEMPTNTFEKYLLNVL